MSALGPRDALWQPRTGRICTCVSGRPIGGSRDDGVRGCPRGRMPEGPDSAHVRNTGAKLIYSIRLGDSNLDDEGPAGERPGTTCLRTTRSVSGFQNVGFLSCFPRLSCDGVRGSILFLGTTLLLLFFNGLVSATYPPQTAGIAGLFCRTCPGSEPETHFGALEHAESAPASHGGQLEVPETMEWNWPTWMPSRARDSCALPEIPTH